MRLIALIVLAAAAAVGLFAGAAGAKEGVEATLLTQVPQDAAAGTTFRVEWKLAELATGHPFGAGQVFVRLESTSGAATMAFADGYGVDGRFAATATVPDGGIARLKIGLRGTTDIYFRVVNNPFTDAWTPLRRPLHTPFIAVGAKCPVSVQHGRRLGPGPAYPIGFERGTLQVAWGVGAFAGSAWGGQKVLWTVDPSYSGPVLIRGAQIDGLTKLRFERGRVPPTELHLAAGTRDRPSYARIKRPGCYAFQIDGLTFSRTIVFRATR